MRAVSLKDQEKFTSPWAVTDIDEEKFDKTISYLGRLLRDDIQLQALYHMLVMLSPCSANSSKIQVRAEILHKILVNNICSRKYLKNIFLGRALE